MVTVDMSTTRAQITKRQRRMRRAAQRRMQRQHKAQLHEIRVAQAARQSRQRAIAAWNAEEERLQRLRETQQNTKNQQVHDAATPLEKPRAVKFAEQMLVTEIPVRGTDKLPKPISSPIGVSICGTDDDNESDNDTNDRTSKSVTFAELCDGVFAEDDDDDPEFAPEESVVSVVPSRPIQRPRRRIVAQRLDVPLEQIIPLKHTKKSKTAHSPKRPRPEAHQSSTSSASSAPSSSPQSDEHNPQAGGNRASGEVPTEEHKSHKQRRPSNEEALKVRLKPKRKRLRNVGNDGQGENERQSAELMLESGNETRSDAAQQHEHAKDRQDNLAKSKQMRPSLEKRASNGNSENPLLTASSAKGAEQSSSSVQNGQAKSASTNREKSSTLANGHSKQNGYKLNGFHGTPETRNQDKHKANDSNDDKDLDNIFGDLIKQKAANRASKEKTAIQKKRKLEENGPDLTDAKAKQKKFKKGPARYTEDGLRIMTYEEIAADQPPGLNGDCPFDCSCCF